MSQTYITTCDGCGLQQRDWPEGNSVIHPGWGSLKTEDLSRDFCPHCLAKILTTKVWGEI